MPHLLETAQKIKAFKNIPIGWHFGEGLPPTPTNIDIALKLNSALDTVGFPSTDAFLGASGEIQVNGYNENIYIELIIDLDNLIEFVYERDNQQLICQDNLSISEAEAKIQFWGRRKWAISELYTKIPTTIQNKDLQLSPLADLARITAYQSSTPIVLPHKEIQDVSIFTASTLKYQVSPPSFLNSTKQIFLMGASS